MKYFLSIFFSAIFLLFGCTDNNLSNNFKNTFNDDLSKTWCYLKKSTTVIGMPFQTDVTQITYDGALYTRFAELCFFYGKNQTPLLALQKNYYNGWIPIVEYNWVDNNIKYSIEMFADALDETHADNTINFVKLTAQNISDKPNSYTLSAATRARLNDYRFGEVKGFSENNLYKIENNSFWRDDNLIYIFPTEGKIDAIKNTQYEKPFTAKEFSITQETPVGIVTYANELKPKETVSMVFKMPRIPIANKEKDFLAKINATDYEQHKEKVIAFWKNKVEENVQIEIPEKQINDARKASIVHLLLATRTLNGHKTQTDGLPYPMFFLTSAPQMTTAYLSCKINDMAKMEVENAIKQQEPDGLYFDRSLSHGGIIPAAHGHVLYVASIYCIMTGDTAMAKQIYPSISKAVGFIKSSIEKDEYGLMPPAYPYDNEMVDGHYASNNFWSLMGLRYAIRLAKMIHKTDVLPQWIALEEKFNENIQKGIKASMEDDNYLRPGLYPYLTGKKARRGFNEFQTNCDWENMLLVYPTEVVSPQDPVVLGTLKHIRNAYGEGIMTYRHGQHLHQYITSNMIGQYMAQGNDKQALIDFYHMQLHSGSTYEAFENLVIPWDARMVSEDCPPPHGWASSIAASTIRTFMVYEYGGRCGVDAAKRDLYLFSVLSPAWVQDGKSISIKNLPTEMGDISATINFSKNKAEIKINSKFTTEFGNIKFKIPFYKELISFTTDAKNSKLENNYIILSPDVTAVSIKWKDKKEEQKNLFKDLLWAYRSTTYFAGVDSTTGAAIVKQQKPFLSKAEEKKRNDTLSFDFVMKTFLHEFDRRKQNNK